MKLIFTLTGLILVTLISISNAQIADNNSVRSTHQLDAAEEVYFIVDDMPEFPGGQDELFTYLVQNMDYPLNARQSGATGTVYITFVIDKSGRVLEPEVLKSIDGYPEFTEEAIRLVSDMPRWKPGMISDKPVNVRYNLPVRFAF